jgi:UTP--glucose-1-phosphate uridylyltransferase
MKKLKILKPGKGGEIHITDAIRQLIAEGEKFYGNIFKGKYLDCGTLDGYIKSAVEISKAKNK